MAHVTIGGKVIVDWTTGDPEGDRISLLAAYRDFIKEIYEELCASHSFDDQLGNNIVDIFNKWNVSTDDQIDEVPRIWIKRPT